MDDYANEVNINDLSIWDEEITYNPEAESSGLVVPPDNVRHLVKWKMGSQGIMLGPDGKPKRDKSGKPFFMVHLQANVVAPGQPYDNATLFYRPTSIVFESGEGRLHDWLKAVGHKPSATTTLGALRQMVLDATAAEAMSNVRGRWEVSVKDGTNEATGKTKYKVVRKGMKTFPQRPDGSYNPTVENDFNLPLQKVANNSIIPTDVADAIRAQVTPAMQQTAEGRTMAQRLLKRAVEFDKPWTMRQLNDERMRLFRMAKGPQAERTALRTNTQVMADNAAEKALRKLVYDEVDRAAGNPTGTAAALKGDEAALISLKDQIEGRIKDLTAVRATLEGAPLLSRLSSKLTTYIHSSGKPAVIAHPFRGTTKTTPKRAAGAVKGAFTPTSNIKTFPVWAGAGMASQPKRPEDED